MSESVSDFQAQVASVMDVLMSVAVKEITKLFEVRSMDSIRSKVETVDHPKEKSVVLSNIRIDMENALKYCGDKYCCSVGVQVGDEVVAQEEKEGNVLTCGYLAVQASKLYGAT